MPANYRHKKMNKLSANIGAAAGRYNNKQRLFSQSANQTVAQLLNLTIKTVVVHMGNGLWGFDQIGELVGKFQDDEFTKYIHTEIDSQLNLF
jgi:hypothetical protein